MTNTYHPLQKRPELHIRSSIDANINTQLPIFCISTLSEKKIISTNCTKNFLLISPISAGSSFGIPWWLNVVENEKHTSILDCGTSAALAHLALDTGIGWVVLNGIPEQIDALYSEKSYQNRILTKRPTTKTFNYTAANPLHHS